MKAAGLMIEKLFSAAVLASLVVGSFYVFGDVQGDPQARLALIQPVAEADSTATQ